MQALLEVSQALGQRIFYYSPYAIVIYEVKGAGASSMDYIIRSVNPACLEIEGWREENVLGRPLGEVRPGADEFGIIKVFRQVWRSGESAYYPASVYREGQERTWFENTVFKLPSGEIVAIYQDVTAKKQAEAELFAEKEKLKVTLYSIGDGVITTDTQGRVEILNEIGEKLTGWKQKEAQGKPLAAVFDIYNEISGEKCADPVEKVLQSGTVVGLANHTVLKAKDGAERVIVDSAAPIKNEGGRLLGVVLVFRDVSEAKEKEKMIEFLSYRDSLTGLYNRAFLEQELKIVDGENQFPAALIMGDIDGLKFFNDVFGHEVGDQVLIKVAEIMGAVCRGSDVISRWSGDQFAVLLPKTTEAVAEEICERIKTTAARTTIADTTLSVSLGCASKTQAEENWADVLKKAEDNMYKSKLLGAQSYRNIVLSSIKSTLYAKSLETEEHGERLGKFCREMGIIMGLPANELDELQVLAMLHDIGKIGIDDRILKKPDKLTGEEWQIMREHTQIGYQIAKIVPELENIADYILAHHERWDGKGYPRGLAGEEIPLLSRILAVADAYDAMTQNRSYRQALTSAEAKQELRKNAGTQFDPRITEIFLEYLEKPV